MKPTILFFFALQTISYLGYSQSDLDPVTITASTNQQNLSTTGRNIITVKGAEFYHLPVHSIDELLRYLPGVEVQQRGIMGSQSDIVIRGGTYQQVLVILDGLRINDPITGHFNSYVPIAPQEIDRIEILKGASSAIYGSDAIGGVIHVITKAFARRQRSGNSPNTVANSFAATLATGQYGLLNGEAGGTIKEESNIFSGGLITNNAKGQPQRGTRGYIHNTTVSLAWSRHLSDHCQLAVRTAYDQRSFAAQNFYTSFVSDTATEKVRSLWNQVALNFHRGNNHLVLQAGYKKVNDGYQFNAAAPPNDNRSSLLQAGAIYSVRLANTTTITGGGQCQNRIIQSNDRGDHDVMQAAAFAILQQQWGDLTLVPALRLDWDEYAGAELVPQLNASFRTGKLQLRGSAGKTIRQPDFTERYNNYNKVLVANGSIGNPRLQAERSRSYEAGADVFLQHFRLSGTAFRREQENVIDWTPTPYSDMPRKDNLSTLGTYALATNVADVNTSGMEVDIQYTHSLHDDQHLTGSLGWVWMDSKSSQATPSFYISSHARLLTNFHLTYTRPRITLSANGVYKLRKEQKGTNNLATVYPEYFMINGRIEAYLLKGRLGVFVEVDNITNTRTSDILGAMLPGRWAMAGIKVLMNQ